MPHNFEFVLSSYLTTLGAVLCYASVVGYKLAKLRKANRRGERVPENRPAPDSQSFSA